MTNFQVLTIHSFQKLNDLTGKEFGEQQENQTN